MQSLKIAFASDENYVMSLGCTITSILKNAGPDEDFTFFLLDGGISDASKEKLEQLKKIRNFELVFLTPDWEVLSRCPTVGYLAQSMYSRLFLPDLLPHEPRILYLDCDLIVTASLSELWNTDLEGKSLGICTDNMEFQRDKFLLGLYHPIKGTQIFNSGVILMDLEKIRENGKFHRCFEWIQANKETTKLPDQDALNECFQDDKKHLPYRWNIQVPTVNGKFVEKFRYVKNEEREEALRNPKGILHFIGAIKPFHYGYSSPYRAFFWTYLEQTPWADFKIPVPSLKERIRYRLRRSILNHYFKKMIQYLKTGIFRRKKTEAKRKTQHFQ